MRAFTRQITPAVIVCLALTVLLGVLYPLAVTAVGQVAFHDEANGSIITVDGVEVGSSLIGQRFTDARYFHPRPSAAGDGYDASMSSGSNLGPNNPALLDAIAERVAAYRTENGLPAGVRVPVDAVTASGSGLDPHISIANARLQAGRVAAARGLSADVVAGLIDAAVDDRPLDVLGEPGVNVLELNVALDRYGP